MIFFYFSMILGCHLEYLWLSFPICSMSIPEMKTEKRSGKHCNLSCFPVKIRPGERQMSTFLFPCVVAESALWYCVQADVGRPFSQASDHSVTERSNWKLNHYVWKYIDYSSIYIFYWFLWVLVNSSRLFFSWIRPTSVLKVTVLFSSEH